MKEELLFYSAYENFYDMAENSICFKEYCKLAFGADFSQDGFSDMDQVNLIFQYIPKLCNPNILDIGCGNGKMLNYLQSKLGGDIYGFDYSQNAIKTARNSYPVNSNFQTGIIGEIDYLPQSFDLITSMDTVYFAKDITKFVGQVRNWLKENGVFFIGYQEGDLMAKTANSETTILAQALQKNGFKYQVINLTKQTYDMLNRKRDAIINHKVAFEKENLQDWFHMILSQTECATVSFDEYEINNSRYIFIARL